MILIRNRIGRRKLYIILSLITISSIALLWQIYFWKTLLKPAVVSSLTSCSDELSSAYLDGLCSDYLTGVVAGSLCEALCVKKEVEFVRCLGHGVKLHVLLAHWGPHTLVLKTAKPVGHERATSHLQHPDRFSRIINKQVFVKDASMSVLMNMGLGGGGGGEGERGMKEVVERLFSECDVLGDGELSYSEAVVCWSLLETDELILLSLLRGLSPIPDLYGVCGNMYATQYASSLPLLSYAPTLVDNRTWNLRARLAISLLDLVENIETTLYGTLYLCDVQESNFGVVRKTESQEIIAKAIDLDISWFERGLRSSVEFERNKECQSNDDCDFISCHVPCNITTHTCVGKVWTNNLQVICERLLDRHVPGISSLLHNPPPTIATRLRSLLDSCSSLSSLPQPHINITLLHQIRSLISSSILLPNYH